MKYLLLILLSLPVATAAQKGAGIIRGGILLQNKYNPAPTGTLSLLAGIGQLGVGACFGIEDNRVTGYGSYPLMAEITTLPQKKKAGPIATMQGGWNFESRRSPIELGLTVRMLIGYQVPTKGNGFGFIQVGYGNQQYTGGRLDQFLLMVGVKF